MFLSICTNEKEPSGAYQIYPSKNRNQKRNGTQLETQAKFIAQTMMTRRRTTATTQNSTILTSGQTTLPNVNYLRMIFFLGNTSSKHKAHVTIKTRRLVPERLLKQPAGRFLSTLLLKCCSADQFLESIPDEY